MSVILVAPMRSHLWQNVSSGSEALRPCHPPRHALSDFDGLKRFGILFLFLRLVPFRWRAAHLAITGIALGGISLMVHGAAAQDIRPEDNTATTFSDPIVIRPHWRSCLPISEVDDAWIRSQIQIPMGNHVTTSALLHVLRAHGFSESLEHPQFHSGPEILSIFCDSKKGAALFGHPLCSKTRFGARFPSRYPSDKTKPSWYEHHRDHTIASFGELGVTPSTRITTDGGMSTVSSVLTDLCSNFHLDQEELEWTSVALALYVSPNATWHDRFGRSYTFDELAQELLSRRMELASCSGIHLLYALTIILRVDMESHRILSDDTRALIRARIEKCVRLVSATQADDGSWPADWYFNSELNVKKRPSTPSPASSDFSQLVVTGHLGEWLTYLPEEFEVPNAVLSRAGIWLINYLRANDGSEKDICPRTHAICLLRCVTRVERPEASEGE